MYPDYRRSREGAWIEIQVTKFMMPWRRRRSREGAWIEIPLKVAWELPLNVAPARERGLKFYITKGDYLYEVGRSREGAWIEISMLTAA